MARNDRMDALGALLGLGIAGAMLDDDNTMATKKENQIEDATRKAVQAKEMYSAYLKVGFTETQAFELVKAVAAR